MISESCPAPGAEDGTGNKHDDGSDEHRPPAKQVLTLPYIGMKIVEEHVSQMTHSISSTPCSSPTMVGRALDSTIWLSDAAASPSSRSGKSADVGLLGLWRRAAHACAPAASRNVAIAVLIELSSSQLTARGHAGRRTSG